MDTFIGWAVFTSLASLASLTALGFELVRSRERLRAYVFLVISMGMAVLTAALWSQNRILVAENTELKSARVKAAALIKSWPEVNRLDFVSTGELRGIVISGLAFLEANRDNFPDTYAATEALLLSELGVGSSNDENWLAERNKIEEAATTMIRTVSSIQVQ